MKPLLAVMEGVAAAVSVIGIGALLSEIHTALGILGVAFGIGVLALQALD